MSYQKFKRRGVLNSVHQIQNKTGTKLPFEEHGKYKQITSNYKEFTIELHYISQRKISQKVTRLPSLKDDETNVKVIRDDQYDLLCMRFNLTRPSSFDVKILGKPSVCMKEICIDVCFT